MSLTLLLVDSEWEKALLGRCVGGFQCGGECARV